MKIFSQGRAALLRGLDFWRRGSAALPLITAVLFFARGAMAQTTNALSDAEIQGRKLAQQLCDVRPDTNFTQSGILEVRDGKKATTDVPIRLEIQASAINSAIDWQTIYETTTESNRVKLVVNHKTGKPDAYLLEEGLPRLGEPIDHMAMVLSGSKTMRPFAMSDFWVCDLGLEFLHWPEQKVLRGDTARGRLCKVLESTNPDPSTNGYSRVLCWIDNETLGIVEAEAYDAKNKKLKEFLPKDFKKVDGQWQVGSMEIDNVQTGSRTRLELDLKAK